MSYEGFSQYLCEKGHYWVSDCYIENDICDVCKTKAVWSYSVDLTNCGGHPYPVEVAKEEKGEQTFKLPTLEEIEKFEKSINCQACGRIPAYSYYDELMKTIPRLPNVY